MTTTFLDVPVYRLSQAEYYRLRDEYVERRLAVTLEILGDEATDPKHERLIESTRQHLIEAYGGAWRFNEIIGYIRLYFLGTQVRGEYVAVAKKRLVRSRTKRFDLRTHKLAMEVQIEHPHTDAMILAAVRKYLARCQQALPRREIDVAVLDVIASHIRWHDLWNETNPFRPH